MNKLQVYCISGLAADKRIFCNLKMEDAEFHFINWKMPAKTDTMRTYALSLAEQVLHPEIVLLGVSFGGMLATELSCIDKETRMTGNNQPTLPFRLLKTIIISSCSHHKQFPFFMQWTAHTRLHRAVPYSLILKNKALNRFAFDLRSREEELYLKRMMLDSTNIELIKRSIHIIMSWKTVSNPEVIHIHGTKDRLLLPAKIQPDYWVEGGGHFMVWNRAAEINGILRELLKEERVKA